MRRILLCVFFVLCAVGRAAFSNVPDSIDIKWMVDGNLYSQSTCEYGGDVIVPNIPTKRGHTFVGWRRNYVELEYLESDSMAYIDTGISGGNDNLAINVMFLISKFAANGYVYANFIESGYNVTRLKLYNDQNQLNASLNIINTNYYTIYTSVIGKKMTIYQDMNQIVVDGVGYVAPNRDSGKINTANITLFNRSIENPVYRDIGLRVYSMQILDNGNLVRDFIPVLDPYGVPCMYDRVTNEFFYNQGTGQFIAGPIKS